MKFLAFDTSTDVMSIALTDGGKGDRIWQHRGPGGAQASSTLIPAILALLAEAGMSLGELDAIAFGRGPGSFTGLRTACAVAQGLALGAGQGAGIPVLPIDTLMALAEEARFQQANESDATMLNVTALLDARMDEMYVQHLSFSGGLWHARGDCMAVRPENFVPESDTAWLAGNVFGVYASRLPASLSALICITALPTASLRPQPSRRGGNASGIASPESRETEPTTGAPSEHDLSDLRQRWSRRLRPQCPSPAG